MSPTPRITPGSVLYAGVLVALGTGLVLITADAWRLGTTVCGGAMLVAAVGRLIVPERMSGLLRVRRRSSDALLMLALGVVLVGMALLIPRQP